MGIALVSLVMTGGLVQLSTEADLLDILPRGNPHTLAAQNASAEFRGFYDFVTVFYQIDEDKCRQASDARLPLRVSSANCGNITDEVYVRAMEEVSQFLRARVPEAEYAIDLAAIVKTVNWTNSGYFGNDPQGGLLAPLLAGQPDRVGSPVDDAFSMPGTDLVGEAQYEAAWRGANAADDSVKDVVAPTWRAGRTLLFFNTQDSEIDRVELGRDFYAAVDDYKAAVSACDDGDGTAGNRGRSTDAADVATSCTLQWNVFSDKGLAVRGVSALDAHASDVTARDVKILAPIVVVALIALMYASFHDWRVIIVSAANLAIAFVWTAGMMGYLGIPFSALNLTIIPLILGVGIDYSIQMVSEYLDHKAQGLTDPQAFREAGALSGMALFVATVTTVGGLLLMVLSPSLLMAQLAIVANIALTVCFLFALTMVPALLVMTTRANLRTKPATGSRSILAICSSLGQHRAIGVAGLLLITGFSLVAVQGLKTETFGNPELNYPPGDRVRDDSDTINDLFFGGSADTVSNYLIVEGDLTQPEAHRFLDTLERNLRAEPELEGFNTASLTRIVRAWTAINQGTPDALVNQFILGSVPDERVQDADYPQTAADIRQTFDDIFASPFANFMTILLNPEQYDMGMVPFDTRQDLSYEEAERVWLATERVIEATHRETGYDGLQVHQFGNNAVSYLFISEELPWVQRVGMASFVLVTAMIAVLTRSWRATLAIATVMALASIWWLGVLPLLGIGLSVGLMLPLVFISAVGSDNALHLIWNLEHVKDQRRVYRFVGKAITVAIATTAMAFLVFSFQTDLLARKTMLATVASVLSLWLATILVVPLFYPPPAPQVAASNAAPAPREI